MSLSLKDKDTHQANLQRTSEHSLWVCTRRKHAPLCLWRCTWACFAIPSYASSSYSPGETARHNVFTTDDSNHGHEIRKGSTIPCSQTGGEEECGTAGLERQSPLSPSHNRHQGLASGSACLASAPPSPGRLPRGHLCNLTKPQFLHL